MAAPVDPRIEKLKDIERRLGELHAWADARFAELRTDQRKLLEQALRDRDKKLMDVAKRSIDATDDKANAAS